MPTDDPSTRRRITAALTGRLGKPSGTAIAVAVLAVLASADVATCQSTGHGLLVVSHAVRDLAEWRQVFDEAADAKRRLGWIGSRVRTADGRPDRVLVIEEFRTLEQARRFAALPELRDGMERAGLIGEPVIDVMAR